MDVVQPYMQRRTVNSVLSDAIVAASANHAARLEELFWTNQQLLSDALAAVRTREGLRPSLLAFAVWNLGSSGDLALQCMHARVSGVVVDPALATLHSSALQLLSPGNDTNHTWVYVRAVLDAVDLRGTPERSGIPVAVRMRALDAKFAECAGTRRGIRRDCDDDVDDDDVHKRQRTHTEEQPAVPAPVDSQVESSPLAPAAVAALPPAVPAPVDSRMESSPPAPAAVAALPPAVLAITAPRSTPGAATSSAVAVDAPPAAPVIDPLPTPVVASSSLQTTTSSDPHQLPKDYRPHLITHLSNSYHAVNADGWLVCHHHECERAFRLLNEASLLSFVARDVYGASCWQTFLCDMHRAEPTNLRDRPYCHNCLRCTGDVHTHTFAKGTFSVRLCGSCLILPNVQAQSGAMDRRRPFRDRRRRIPKTHGARMRRRNQEAIETRSSVQAAPPAPTVMRERIAVPPPPLPIFVQAPSATQNEADAPLLQERRSAVDVCEPIARPPSAPAQPVSEPREHIAAAPALNSDATRSTPAQPLPPLQTYVSARQLDTPSAMSTDETVEAAEPPAHLRRFFLPVPPPPDLQIPGVRFYVSSRRSGPGAH